jgi:hypothetical protein
MGSERGQAIVEWIGLLMLVTMALLALARAAPKADDRSLGITLASAITTTAKHAGSAGARAGEVARLGTRPDARPDASRSALPDAPRLALPDAPRLALPDARQLFALADPLRAGVLPGLRLPRPGAGGRVVRGARGLWRRAWFACLVWERVKYSLLHPEARVPGYSFPYDVVLKTVTRCVSPVDVFRDVGQLEQRP